jgi:hypothetical protein
MVKKTGTPKKPTKTTLASVKREMDLPREAASVREDVKYQSIVTAEKSD